MPNLLNCMEKEWNVPNELRGGHGEGAYADHFWIIHKVCKPQSVELAALLSVTEVFKEKPSDHRQISQRFHKNSSHHDAMTANTSIYRMLTLCTRLRDTGKARLK